jgi:hypothetical protein
VEQDLACACGERRFRVRVDRDEQVGLLTCAEGHHSFLLDSHDYWDDVIQDHKPREHRCKCGGRDHGVHLDYELRENGAVRTIAVELRCVLCKHAVLAATFEIDYEPTDELISRPLEPCDEPWLTAKRTTVTALWIPKDLEDLLRYLGESELAHCYYAGFEERPRLASAAEICRALGSGPRDLYFSTSELDFPSGLDGCWKRMPVIHVSTPTTMGYRTGNGSLYYVEWANQLLVARRIVAQEAGLLELADRLEAWLRTRFTSARGKRTFDNHAEYHRLKGGW